MTTYDLTTFGEAQIRLTVAKGERLATAQHLRITPAGSEANVAGLLAQLRRKTAFATVMPTGDLAQRFIDEYRGVGVDLSHVVQKKGGRMALYFMEPGDPPLPARVTYDREWTPFRIITPESFNWDALLDTRVLFLTGITAALTEETATTVAFAAKEAAARGVKVALDINYRGLLWTTARARAVLEPLLEMTSILFCSRLDGIKVFDAHGDGPTVNRWLRETYDLDHVVSTDAIAGVYYSGVEGDAVYPVESIGVRDRPGAGDSFVAGTLHGYLDDSVREGIDYGLRTSKLALTHYGDLTHVTPSELENLTTSDIVR